MAERLVVIGASGFGREVLDVAEAMNAASSQPVWDVVGVVDDGPSDLNLTRLTDRDVAYLGTVDELSRVGSVWTVVGIGSPSARRSIVERLGPGARWASLVHPTAVVGSRVRLGAGVVVCAGVSVGTNVQIGDHGHLNPHAVVGHDTCVEPFVSVNPNATVSGDCLVETGVLVGAGATVLQGLVVGSAATVGAAACVTQNVPPAVTVKGVPAR